MYKACQGACSKVKKKTSRPNYLSWKSRSLKQRSHRWGGDLALYLVLWLAVCLLEITFLKRMPQSVTCLTKGKAEGKAYAYKPTILPAV